MFMKREDIENKIIECIEKSKKYKGVGEVASYIPELENVDKDVFALSIVTTSGDVYNFGESEKIFSVQSISKIFTLIMALKDNTIDEVFSKVGTEPTRYEFNSLIPIDQRAANPFINAGAITTTSMIYGKSKEEKFERVIELIDEMSQGGNFSFMEDIYKSEISTTDRNRAIAYYLKSKNIFNQNADEVLDLYVRICAIGSNVETLARFGAVLANEGFDIYSSNLIVPQNIVQMTIAQMASCGMYETSGEYLMKVGIPSKSGVGGGILGVVPNKCGICVYSPRLDKSGNSVVGKNLLKILSADLGLNIFL
ncbi:glutaminase A [Anaerococcus rubeinfantis]|uniref:glutaminase A n=1 Tax=Anaerococcus rubeinfantis TaxID=1720199 RepID=UPI00073E602F|nr:glutaminase A [Anaerococcus rubeinfantis]